MRLSAVKIIARVHFRGITAACVSITGEIIELRGAAMIFCSSGLTSAGTGRVFAGTSNVCHCDLFVLYCRTRSIATPQPRFAPSHEDKAASIR